MTRREIQGMIQNVFDRRDTMKPYEFMYQVGWIAGLIVDLRRRQSPDYKPLRNDPRWREINHKALSMIWDENTQKEEHMAAMTSGEKVIAKLEWVRDKIENIALETQDAIQDAVCREIDRTLRETIGTIKTWMKAGSKPPLQKEEEPMLESEQPSFLQEFIKNEASIRVHQRHMEELIQRGYSKKKASARVYREMVGGKFRDEIQQEMREMNQCISGRNKEEG
jgi:hypothetical protein